MDDNQYLPLEEAKVILQKVSRSHGFDSADDSLFKNLTASVELFEVDKEFYVNGNELKNFVQNFQAFAKGYGKTRKDLEQSRGMIRQPVDVLEFIESSDYYGQGGSLFESTRKTYREIWEDPNRYHEIVLTGGESIGKSYTAEGNLAYMVYRLSCYENPQVEFGLAPGSDIIFVHQSITLTKAKKVLLNQCAARIAASPYFKKYFMFDKNVKSELRFPKQITIMPLGGSDTAAIGLNVLGGCFPAGQKYLLADGTLGDIEDVSQDPNRKCLTIDELNFIMKSKNKTRTVCTGFKQVIKLHFDNGESIVCTPEQKFKGLKHEWIKASEAEGKSFKFTSMQDMWIEGYLHNPTFNIVPQKVRQGIQEEVSFREVVREGSIEDSTKQEAVKGVYNLLCLQKSLQNDYKQSSCFSPYDDKTIPEHVSQSFNENEGSEEELVGVVESACVETTQRSEVQESFTTRNKKSSSFGLGKKQRINERSKRTGQGFQKSKEAVGFYAEERKNSSCNEGVKGISEIFLPQQKQRRGNFGFKAGNSDGFLVRLCGDQMGIRTRLYSLFSKWVSPLFYTRLQGWWSLLRGQRIYSCSQGQELEIQKEVYKEKSNDSNCSVSRKSRNGNGLSYVSQKQSKRDKFRETYKKISSATCVKVEFLNNVAPVYDVEEVEDTHTFFAATQTGFLLSSNCVDELNFMQRITNSAKTLFHVKNEYDQAEELYGAIMRRIKGRFAKARKVPGKLFLVSARNYPGDFTSRKCEEAKTDSTIYVMNYAQWEALPPDRYSKETFLVEVGNEFKQSRIVASREEAEEESDVIEIPVYPYKKDFLRDIEGALRSYGGIATGSKNPFIPQRDLIISASASHVKLTGGKSLFKKDSIVIDKYWNKSEAPDWTQIVDMKYVDECILDPNVAFAVHVDLATTQCNAGIAVGRVLGFNNMTSYSVYSEATKSFKEVSNVLAPVFMIDGVLAIMPPIGDEIDIDAIRSLVLWLKTILNIKWATADSHESAAMLQAFRKHGIRSGVVSVEMSTAPYVTYKEAIKDERVFYPDHELLKKENRELERDTKQDKIVKPPGGSKDLADSAASVVYILTIKEGAPRQTAMRNLDLNDEKVAEKSHVRQIRTLDDSSIEKQREDLMATLL